MAEIEALGNVLIVTGGVLLLLGIILAVGGKLPFFGQLPGDITIDKGGIKIYFPVVTFLIISILFTVLLNVLPR